MLVERLAEATDRAGARSVAERTATADDLTEIGEVVAPIDDERR